MPKKNYSAEHRKKMREAGYVSKEVMLKDKQIVMIEEIQSQQGHNSIRETIEYILNEFEHMKNQQANQQAGIGDQQPMSG